MVDGSRMADGVTVREACFMSSIPQLTIHQCHLWVAFIWLQRFAKSHNQDMKWQAGYSKSNFNKTATKQKFTWASILTHEMQGSFIELEQNLSQECCHLNKKNDVGKFQVTAWNARKMTIFLKEWWLAMKPGATSTIWKPRDNKENGTLHLRPIKKSHGFWSQKWKQCSFVSSMCMELFTPNFCLRVRLWTKNSTWKFLGDFAMQSERKDLNCG